jgi:hypothetical protein
VALVAVGADAEVCHGTGMRWAVRCTMGKESLLSLNTVSRLHLGRRDRALH